MSDRRGNYQKMVVESITHPGLRRQENEDRFLIRRFNDAAALLVVADGMGGHAGAKLRPNWPSKPWQTLHSPNRIEHGN